MKIAIAGGRTEADFLIGSLVKKKHAVVAINEDREWCEHMAETHQTPIICGDPCKEYVLRDARIAGFDVIIALMPEDYDNLGICQMARQLFGVKKAVCTVSNPQNVAIFGKLGINNVISAAYLISTIIEQASTFENLVQALSLEEGRVSIVEVLIEEKFACIGKTLSELDFPLNSIVACVIRNTDMLVPNGQTSLRLNDKLLIVASPESQNSAIAALNTKAI